MRAKPGHLDRWGLGWLCAAPWLVVSLPGRAAPSPSEPPASPASAISAPAANVTWTRGPGAQGCPTQDQFRAELLALGAPTSTGAASAVNVRVEREGSGWVAVIRVGAADGQHVDRELRSDAEPCDGIFSAAAVATLLVIQGDATPAPPLPSEPHATEHTAAEDTAAEDTAAEDTAAEDTAGDGRAVDDSARAVLEAPPQPTALDHSFELGATIARGLLPRLALGAVARYGFPLSARTSLSLRGLFLPERHVRLSEGGLGFSLLALGAGVSHRFWHWQGSSLLGSLDLQLGRLQVDVEPPLRPGRSALFWSCASLALRAEQRLGSLLFVAAELSLGVPLGPLRFGVAGGGVLAEVDPVTISSLVALGAHF